MILTGDVMEIRVLRYFLEAAREGNITRAAARLHVSQPTMSKQLKDLEAELGKQLFTRTNYSIKLTEAGMLLRKRAEDIIALVDKTEAEFKSFDDSIGGNIYVGCPESDSIKYFARAVKRLQEKHPNVRCNMQSGNLEDVTERLDKGLLDFAIVMDFVDLAKYNYIDVPASDRWGVIMRKDDALAEKESLTLNELSDLPLICSRQGMAVDFPKWFGNNGENLNIVATFNLSYNASVMVKEGIGYAITFDKLTDISSDSELCFIPITDVKNSEMKIIWRKYQVLSPIAELLLKELQNEFER